MSRKIAWPTLVRIEQVDDNPLPWLPEPAWQGVAALGELEEFAKFSSDLVEAGPRFREWFNHITPETEKLPLDWYASHLKNTFGAYNL